MRRLSSLEAFAAPFRRLSQKSVAYFRTTESRYTMKGVPAFCQGSEKYSRSNLMRKGEILLNYTENYQLPQWEKSDRVLMEDFNAANNKVDAALGKCSEEIQHVAVQKLAEKSLTASAGNLEVDLSQVDLSQYNAIFFIIRGGCSLTGAILYLQLNQDTEKNYDYCEPNGSIEYTTNAWNLCSSFNGSAVCRGEILSSDTDGKVGAYWSSVYYNSPLIVSQTYAGLHKTLLFNSIKKMKFYCDSGNLKKGTQATIYGLRK